MTYSITIKETIFINRSPEDVWDFTQDHDKRALWDSSVKETTLLQIEPRRVDIRGPFFCAELVYKQYDRPVKTSLAMANIRSLFIGSGGGSWRYESTNGGTEWTQTNTVMLIPSRFDFLLKPMISFFLTVNTKRSMKNARRLLEKDKK